MSDIKALKCFETDDVLTCLETDDVIILSKLDQKLYPVLVWSGRLKPFPERIL